MVPTYGDIMRWSRFWLMQNAIATIFILRNWLLRHALVIHLDTSWKWYRYLTDNYVLRHYKVLLICIISISIRLNTFVYCRIFSFHCCISWEFLVFRCIAPKEKCIWRAWNRITSVCFISDWNLLCIITWPWNLINRYTHTVEVLNQTFVMVYFTSYVHCGP